MMSYVSIFSGIECASVAVKDFCWNPIAFSEIKEFPSAVLSYHYPYVKNVGDMTCFDWGIYNGKADVVIGGPPCQAFSVIGNRKSLDDDRGGLSIKYVRAIHDIDPKFSITENVPGWITAKDNAFGICLAQLVGATGELKSPLPDGKWSRSGMVAGPKRTAAWRILDSQYFGLAQKRKRVYVVSCRTRDGINPGSVLFEPTYLSEYYNSSRQERSCHSFVSESRNGKSGILELVYPELSHTLRSHSDSHRIDMESYIAHGDRIRRLSPRERERLMGLPDDYTLIPFKKGMSSENHRMLAIGNGMAVNVIRWICEKIINAENNTKHLR